MTFVKAYILLLPLSYFVLMLIIICIKRKISKCSHFGYSVLYTILSFGCSAWEGFRDKNGEDNILKQKFKLRPISKTVFTIVLIGFAVHFSKTTAPGLLSNDPTNTELTFNNSIISRHNKVSICFCIRIFFVIKVNYLKIVVYTLLSLIGLSLYWMKNRFLQKLNLQW